MVLVGKKESPTAFYGREVFDLGSSPNNDRNVSKLMDGPSATIESAESRMVARWDNEGGVQLSINGINLGVTDSVRALQQG